MNKSHKVAMALAVLTSVVISSESSAITMPHKYETGNRCYSGKFLGRKIAEGCYRVYERARSDHRNHFTINTHVEANGRIFNSGRKRIQFIANGWEKGTSGRATRAWFRVNGKTIANIYQKKYGSNSARAVYTTPFRKDIGAGRLSVSVGPISVTVGAKLEANVKPAMYVHAQNPTPTSTRNGWVRVIHRDSIKLTANPSAGISVLVAKASISGNLNLINFNTGLSSPKDTKLLLKRSVNGNKYYNYTHVNLCTLGGDIKASVTLGVWPLKKTYNKTLANWNGICSRKRPVNIDRWIQYKNPSSVLFAPVTTNVAALL